MQLDWGTRPRTHVPRTHSLTCEQDIPCPFLIKQFIPTNLAAQVVSVRFPGPLRKSNVVRLVYWAPVFKCRRTARFDLRLWRAFFFHFFSVCCSSILSRDLHTAATTHFRPTWPAYRHTSCGRRWRQPTSHILTLKLCATTSTIYFLDDASRSGCVQLNIYWKIFCWWL